MVKRKKRINLFETSASVPGAKTARERFHERKKRANRASSTNQIEFSVFHVGNCCCCCYFIRFCLRECKYSVVVACVHVFAASIYKNKKSNVIRVCASLAHFC